MKTNVNEFETLLKKATMNYSINTAQIRLEDGKIKSNMISSASDCITLLDMDNTVFQADEYLEFNFLDPNINLVPFLNLVDEDEVDIDVNDEKIVLKSSNQRANIHFCSPHVVGVFSANSVREDLSSFLTLDIDDMFIEAYQKIKKIGNRFKQVYFNIENNAFVIESTDKTNRYSNGLKINLVDKIAKKKSDAPNDLSLCFDFRNFTNFMTVINGDADRFKVSFTYNFDQELGMMCGEKDDGSEKYILMSRREGGE